MVKPPRLARQTYRLQVVFEHSFISMSWLSILPNLDHVLSRVENGYVSRANLVLSLFDCKCIFEFARHLHGTSMTLNCESLLCLQVGEALL
jgi:hypothetical protein